MNQIFLHAKHFKRLPLKLVLLVWLTCLVFPVNAGLTLTTWNMEWLSDKGDQVQSVCNNNDYLMMESVFSLINPDVLAFQEVDSLKVLEKIVDSSKYDMYLSDRAKGKEMYRSSQQYTGWVVRKGIEVIDRSDFKPLGLPTFLSDGVLRYGSYIEIRPKNSRPLHLLSIHLKSGCFKTPIRRNNSCKKLDRQAEALALWINTRIAQKQEFVIAGDFNHYLNEPDEWFWKTLTETIDEKHLVNLTKNIEAKCKARKYNYRLKKWDQVVYSKLVDHIIASPGAIRHDYMPPAGQYKYSYHSVMNFRLSDHCPVSVLL